MAMTPATTFPAQARERVLPTLNRDGTRRWLLPKLSPGRFWKRRRALGWALIAMFTLIPYLRMNGKPLILLDIARRQFTLFGATFLPTDTMLLMLLLVGIFLGIFLLTAVYGRVWCGWACPQTVYMEFLYRPIERFIEGGRGAQLRATGGRWSVRRLVKHAVFLLLSMFLAHTFLAYFVGVEALRHWITRPPFEHPLAFLVMACTTLLMLLDFGWFREQVCLVACPYGRFQSVLLDRRSLIVGYDARRGEPRGMQRVRRNGSDRGGRWGDCIDCGACVVTCPTGIDIRDGLQMECIHCTQCMDACDAVMSKIGRPLGLIRYSSKDELAGQPRRMLRPRIILYPLLLLLVWGAFSLALARREPVDVTVLRGLGTPWSLLPSGEVSDQIRIKIVNRRGSDQHYLIELADADGVKLVAPDNPLPVAAGKTATATVFVVAARGAFDEGRRDIRFRISDDAGFRTEVPYRVLGPKDEHERHERGEHREEGRDGRRH
jgi:cytochrome c oxidase accessory protein FixG